VSTTSHRPSPHLQQRRSQRILLSVPVVISGTRSNDAPFSEKTVTQIVNAHGALIQLREPVLIGQKIRLNNVSTNEEIECSVVDINKGNTIPEVGLAFVDPAPHFWRVSFPPADWSPRSPEAKRYSSDHDFGSPSVTHK
jgi:hypothetical protein